MVELRKIGLCDAEYMLAVENDPRVWGYSTLCDAPYTLEQIQDFITASPERFVIECDHSPAGFIDLYDTDELARSAFFSIIVYPYELQGCGVGTEAIRALLNHLNAKGDVETLYALFHPENTPAISFIESCGFKHINNNQQGVLYSFKISKI